MARNGATFRNNQERSWNGERKSDEARCETGGLEAADHGMPQQRTSGEDVVRAERVQYVNILPLGTGAVRADQEASM